MGIKSTILKYINNSGYALTKVRPEVEIEKDFSPEFYKIYLSCREFSMTSVERMYALFQAINYIEKNQISGDVIECGVWKGGSSMLAARTLLNAHSSARNFYLYDTFEGMSDPTEKDRSVNGNNAFENWDKVSKEDKIFCYSSLDEVNANMKSTGYPFEKIHFIKGKVEDTIPGVIPEKIAILRLDTDWYESTYHELKHLFPRLVVGGVLIIDDYGHWQGAREAVDQYFTENGIFPLLNRIDYTGRMMIKIK